MRQGEEGRGLCTVPFLGMFDCLSWTPGPGAGTSIGFSELSV